jgi:anti-anti-sigma factor
MNSQIDQNEKPLAFRAPGDILSTNAEALQNEIDVLLETGDGAVLNWKTFKLYLTATKMIDSAGMSLIATLFKRVQKRGARMQITYSSPNILRTFTFTRLCEHVDLVKV